MRTERKPSRAGDIWENDLLEAIAQRTELDEDEVFTANEIARLIGENAITYVNIFGKTSRILGYSKRKAERDLQELTDKGLLTKTERGYRINPNEFNRTLSQYDSREMQQVGE